MRWGWRQWNEPLVPLRTPGVRTRAIPRERLQYARSAKVDTWRADQIAGWSCHDALRRGRSLQNVTCACCGQDREPDIDPTTNGAGCYMIVADVDGWHERLVAAGLPVTAVEDQPWNMHEFTLTDPSGNHIRIGQPTSG